MPNETANENNEQKVPDLLMPIGQKVTYARGFLLYLPAKVTRAEVEQQEAFKQLLAKLQAYAIKQYPLHTEMAASNVESREFNYLVDNVEHFALTTGNALTEVTLIVNVSLWYTNEINDYLLDLTGAVAFNDNQYLAELLGADLGKISE